MLPTKLSDTTESHIRSLLDLAIPEGPRLDYKRELPQDWTSESKARFIADLVAFANAGGGDLIYGIDEGSGGATAGTIVPLLFPNTDQTIRQLQDIALAGVEPPIPALALQPVALAGGGHCLVIRVPQSWAGPHRCVKTRQFYIRDGARNRPLVVHEIGKLFVDSNSRASAVEQFRVNRLSKIALDETPEKLVAGPKLVVHVIAAQSLTSNVLIDPLVYRHARLSLPALLSNFVAWTKLNLDGAFGPGLQRADNQIYTQQFRSGSFEGVWSLKPLHESNGLPCLPAKNAMASISKFVDEIRRQLNWFGINNSVVVLLSLLGADRVHLAVDSGSIFHPNPYLAPSFDRRDLLLPNELIEEDASTYEGMRPLYDLLFQAAGYDGAPTQ